VLELDTSRGHTFVMTQWIDEFAASLDSAARQKNAQYQHDLLRDRLIQEHAPLFFQGLVLELQAQAAELNEKIGGSFNGVTCTGDRNPNSVLVNTGNHAMTLTCTINLKGRLFTADIRRTSSVVQTTAYKHEFNFRVNPETDVVWVTREEKKYYDPKEIASMLLRETFTGKP
jgi:hypothetical protein